MSNKKEKYTKEFENTIEQIPATGKIVMILDNERIHHARLMQPFLEKINKVPHNTIE